MRNSIKTMFCYKKGAVALVVFWTLVKISFSEPLPDENYDVYQKSSDWSAWSDWSECSRSCDGGVSYQKRMCNVDKCYGPESQYKICNMQACPDNIDFREYQCSRFDSVAYKGDLMSWKAYHHPQDLCALYCVNQYHDIEQMAAKVQDGTRCRPGSLDMCIDGKCQPVGCDLQIGSTATVDTCGICGGDGRSCSLPQYQWDENANTTCSVKCGGGYKVSQPVCQNVATGETVEEKLCDIAKMPGVRLMECNIEPCPPKWEAGEWSVCSQSCGSGIKRRKLYCVEEYNKTKVKVFSHLCKGHKPQMQEPCNMQPCPPQWITGQWRTCSATCGQGIQTRNVTCNKNPSDFVECDPSEKPAMEQKCFTDISCEEEKFSIYDDGPRSSAFSYKNFDYDVQASKLTGKQQSTGSLQPMFVAEEWGPCSASCNEGIRKRKVYCKAHLDYTNIMTKFTDDTCGGEKPAEVERCVIRPCTASDWDPTVRDGFRDDANEDSQLPRVAPGAYGKTYSWKMNGYTPCTATCLGGVQELIIICIRNEDQKVVSPYLCDTKTQPPVTTQTCNDHPCPPRWNISEYSQCSKSCGIGIQTRDVNCIHEVTMSNTVPVPNDMCEQPPPSDRQQCNIVDCPISWHVSNWTKCTKTCGGGTKSRQVECRQITAQNHVITHPHHMCDGQKPPDTRPCNPRACTSGTNAHHAMVSAVLRQFYIQEDPRETEVTVKIGGRAVVFAGTRVKIKCPVKNFPKEKIIWYKGSTELQSVGNHKINKKGMLRIASLTQRDNATYTCKAGNSYGNITIIIKPRPSNFPPSSEEYDKQNSQLDNAKTLGYSGNPVFNPEDENSHELNHDKVPQKKPASKKKISAATTNFHPIGATTDEPMGTPHEVVDSLLPSSTSRANRLKPFLHQFFINILNLWSVHGFRNIRNQRMLPGESTLSSSEKMRIAETTTETIVDTTLTKNLENVKFEWFVTQWSNCTPPCGGVGFQVRSAHCLVNLNNVTQNVDNKLCEDAGLPAPVTIQKCEMLACPHWITGGWQDCHVSRCFAWNTAMQKRDVLCESANGTFVQEEMCVASEKPTAKQECYNDLCKGTWKVGEWTECHASCDKDGVKYRILQCVWFGTNKPAGTACRDLTRPAVIRPCRGAACSELNACKDQSKYCQNVKTMNMCRLRRYQVQCCQSCSDAN